MRPSTEPSAEVRTAEIIGTLCLATDLGMGFPFEHGLQTTLIAMRLADTARGRPRDRRPDVLRLAALTRRLHHGGARRRTRSSAAR